MTSKPGALYVPFTIAACTAWAFAMIWGVSTENKRHHEARMACIKAGATWTNGDCTNDQ